MAYWLFKSEPNDYAYVDLERDRTTVWDGINNALALKYLRTAAIGDWALIYHTGKERRAVGIAEVITAPYPDPQLQDPKRTVVDVKPVRSLPCPVSLNDIKADHAQHQTFTGFELLRLARLSVVPVSVPHWTRILYLAGDSA